MSNMSSGKQNESAATYGGIFGGISPLLVMIVVMILLAVNGMRSTSNFWSAGFIAVIVGFFVYKDKSRFQDALMKGFTNNILAFIVACMLFAGVLSKVIKTAHLVDAMFWGASQIHMSPGMMPLFVF